MKKFCQVCSTEFSTRGRKRQRCFTSCGAATKIKIVGCVACGGLLITSPRGVRAYCNNKCRYKANYKPVEKKLKECSECGKAFKTNSPHQSLCSSACRSIAKRHARREKDAQKEKALCGTCGQKTQNPPNKSGVRCCRKCGLAKIDARCALCQKDFIPKWKKYKKFCSTKCRKQRVLVNSIGKSTRVPWRECSGCGKVFISRATRKTCSRQCHTKVSRESWLRIYAEKHARPLIDKTCDECGADFQSTKQSARFCNPKCGNKAARRCSARLRKMRIRSRKRESFGLYEIAVRDRFTCSLCGDSVDITLHKNNPLAPNLDHIIPISKGGTHTRRNISLTHRVCNIKKADIEPEKIAHLVADPEMYILKMRISRLTTIYGSV